ncbi:23S rRNA (adenine(2030)-N(6))-methyltransferase RlmJ [Aureimonas fodinaquatilis]|uniref:Ribosomal RNA large subunit methyltransferase J n=1 Tax=Aureimonas fodinaquatilis TaxID=2565783 RepID=A0A5B0DYG1_9HYPH|nr:23S rRNA (adenine(2030)-N(6))-methyltransferase RlmJ [Aureimonas fodinaquatilis]KAA0970229.1 23S rRNA (adenine(2030)-N(6))-methyltransferase RlmJ [Aureimonas fodinaquatilis]
MNYRHAFHAGNFADVHKHALLARLVDYLKRKDKPFRVYDTHAGIGVYDLTADEAVRTGEFHQGIQRVLASDADQHPLLSDYLAIVRELNKQLELPSYPGSPYIVRQMLRRQDRLSAYELHPADFKTLASHFAGDVQVKTIELDGWLALGGHVPPKEKRGLVLIDPPFEAVDEFSRIVEQLSRAWQRWSSGIYAIWYPIKRRSVVEEFHRQLAQSGIANIVAAEFCRESDADEHRLVGSGLIVINPPYVFAQEAQTIMDILQPLLAISPNARGTIKTLAGERQ